MKSFVIKGKNPETKEEKIYYRSQDNNQSKLFDLIFNCLDIDHNLYILAGGAVGGGKTKSGVAVVIGFCLRYPGSRAYVCRKDFADLKDTTYKDFVSLCPPGNIKSPKTALKDLADAAHDILFWNGSQIMFRELKDLSGKFGLEVNMIFVDQAEEVDFDVYHAMDTRLRPWPGAPKSPFVMLLTANPHPGWVKSEFIDKKQDHHHYLHFSPKENSDLLKVRPYYIADLEKKFPKAWIQRYLEGDWDISVEGAIFQEFDRDLHVVPEFRIPVSWPRFFVLDPHLSRPMVGLWHAQSPEGEGYVYDELIGSPDDSFSDYLMKMLAKEKDHARYEELNTYRIIDYSLASVMHKKGAGQSLKDIIYKMGLSFANANKKDKWSNIMMVKDRLRPSNSSVPLIYITSNCKRMIWEMQNYRFHEDDPSKDVKEKIFKRDDDLVDCLQYVIASKPWTFNMSKSYSGRTISYVGNHGRKPSYDSDDDLLNEKTLDYEEMKRRFEKN